MDKVLNQKTACGALLDQVLNKKATCGARMKVEEVFYKINKDGLREVFRLYGVEAGLRFFLKSSKRRTIVCVTMIGAKSKWPMMNVRYLRRGRLDPSGRGGL